jgi:hypothetical protein
MEPIQRRWDRYCLRMATPSTVWRHTRAAVQHGLDQPLHKAHTVQTKPLEAPTISRAVAHSFQPRLAVALTATTAMTNGSTARTAGEARDKRGTTAGTAPWAALPRRTRCHASPATETVDQPRPTMLSRRPPDHARLRPADRRPPLKLLSA